MKGKGRERVVEGNVAHDAADAGNPIKIGGISETGTRSSVADGDRVDAHFDQYGNLAVFIGADGGTTFANIADAADGFSTITGLVTNALTLAFAPDSAFDRLRTVGTAAGLGLGVLAASPRTPGASEVKALYDETGSTSTTAEQILNPTSGKKIRIISITYFTDTTQMHGLEMYFGVGDTPGANITTNSTRAILHGLHDRDDPTSTTFYWSWPDGAGPIAVAADDSLYIRTDTDISAAGHVVVHYREE
jgi:hypothetical protein